MEIEEIKTELPSVIESETFNDLMLFVAFDGTILDFKSTTETFFPHLKPQLGKTKLEDLFKENNFPCPLDLERLKLQNGFYVINIDYHTDKPNCCTVQWSVSLVKANSHQYVIMLGKIMNRLQLDPSHYLNQFIHAMPGSLYWKDLDGVYLGCNQFMVTACRLKSVYDIVGKTDYDLWPQQAAKLIRNDNYVTSTGTTISVKEEVELHNKVHYFTGVKCPLKDHNGNIIGMIGNSLDITELKETQAQLLKTKQSEIANKIKSEFIANMSHDLRTPLAGIIGYTEILESRLADGELLTYATEAHQAATRLMQLFNEILDLANNFEADDILGSKQTFDLQKIISNVESLFRPSLNTNDIKLNIDFDEDIPPALYGYQVLLHRVVLNLVGNATKFTEQGHIDISAKLVSSHNNELMISLSVSDTGIGIPEDQQKTIFEPFKRLSASYENKYHGSGLGLYIVKKFLSRMGGSIEVNSAPGQGSAFKCLIPLSIAQTSLWSPGSINSQPSSQIPAKPRTSYKVLIVEDDPMAQTIEKTQMNNAHCHADIASTGQEALELLERARYDLILMDIGLSDKSGIEVAKIIRLFESQTDRKPTPIIALTAHVSPEGENECLQTGMNKVLQKPLTAQLTHEIIETFLASHEKDNKNKDKVIDISEAQKLLGDNPNMIKQALSMLIAQINDSSSHLAMAYHNQQWKVLQKCVHKLHGAIAYCGVPLLKDVCFKLETALQEEKIDAKEIQKLYQHFLAEVNAVTEAYQKL